jgi:transposase
MLMAQRKSRIPRTDLPRELHGKNYYGYRARGDQQTLESFNVEGLPIVNHILQRMNLKAFLDAHLPPADNRNKMATSTALLLLVRNVIMSRQPLYGVGEWAEHFAAPLLGLRSLDQLEHLNDDRIGRALDKLFDVDIPQMILAVMQHVVREFAVQLDEFHNDATTVSFFGEYEDAQEEKKRRGRKRIAINRGHSKARRPDLKQLLFSLTITNDGGIPVHYAVDNGNASEQDLHSRNWAFLKELAGNTDFLYVADCKLATTKNMEFIDRQDGRFITVLPATRKEEQEFRDRLLKNPDAIEWDLLYETFDEHQQLEKRIFLCKDSILSAEGYRILWGLNTQKREHDIHMRTRQINRAVKQLLKLRDKLHSPKTRYRDRAKVAVAVDQILKTHTVERWITVEINEKKEERYKADKRGRPTKNTRFTKKTLSRFNITYTIDAARLAEDDKTAGVFSLITNVTDMSDEDIVRAYGRQPVVEKRFKHLKTDYRVAPVFLKEATRIQAFLCIYFLGLLVQALLEREIRQAMQTRYKAIPLYPEDRDCKAPSSRRLLDSFEGVQMHLLRQGRQTQTFFTELSPLQRTILKLLGIPGGEYGL